MQACTHTVLVVSRHSLEAAPPEVRHLPHLDRTIATGTVETVRVSHQRPNGALVTSEKKEGGRERGEREREWGREGEGKH